MKVSLGPRTLLYPTPVLIVGTYDASDKPNAMNAAWGGIVCSQPPCLAVSVTKTRHTYEGLVTRKAFTVSIPSQDFIRQADYFGIISGKEENKFAAAKLTPQRSALVDAPYVQEFPLVIECEVIKIVEIGSHVQFIGEIKDVKVEKTCRLKDGMPDINKLKPLVFDPGSHTYHAVGKTLGKAFSIGFQKK